MNITFRSIGIGETFKLNGNMYVKRSTRTAQMLMPNLSRVGIFYIGQYETCNV